MQRSKCRPIGDFSENGVNSCFGSAERVDSRALEQVVWTSMVLMTANEILEQWYPQHPWGEVGRWFAAS